jgi:S-methylmethionine-dependent homocysteine/selenocysteine methylase
MFFLDENGNYNFDATKLREAHEWCRNNVDNTMSFGIDVVVSNTFTQKWEMDAYYELAKKHNYVVFSLIVENRHGGVNKHNVPEDKLLAMKERFEYSL